MEKIITFETLRNFAYCNDRIVTRPIRGIVLNFFGLNGNVMFDGEAEDGERFAKEGLLYIIPYYNPWSWMNRQTVDYMDEILDVVIDGLGLDDNIPIASTGGSMGGLSALVYTAYAKRTPVSCVANCPVCDLPFHYTERGDLPRTLYSAFGTYEGTMQEAMESASPLHLAAKMPTETKYIIFHCDADTAVNKEKHSDRFVATMRPDHDLVYHEVAGKGHCELGDLWPLYNKLIVESLVK